MRLCSFVLTSSVVACFVADVSQSSETAQPRGKIDRANDTIANRTSTISHF